MVRLSRPGRKVLWWGMSDPPLRLAIIECSVCSAWIEIFPQTEREGPSVVWNMRDESLCKSPPAGRCPQVRAEIKRRYPDFNVSL
jgi:hypothetical protein